MRYRLFYRVGAVYLKVGNGSKALPPTNAQWRLCRVYNLDGLKVRVYYMPADNASLSGEGSIGLRRKLEVSILRQVKRCNRNKHC